MTPIENVASGLRVPIASPIRVRWFDTVPRLFADGVPVTPVNLAFRNRISNGQTPASTRSYVYAAQLFLSFLAARRLSFIDVTNDDFALFARALLGQSFLDADGRDVRLPGKRAPITGQNTVARLYGLFGDIEAEYSMTFDWRRFRPARYRAGRHITAREHRFRVPVKAPLALPDEQFGHLLERASDLWRDDIADGDRAFAGDPDSQRGALFARNVAILMLLRFAGARRAEVTPLDLGDIDRAEGLIHLVTKARQGAKEPVVLLPVVDAALAWYIFSFRPYGLRPFRIGAKQRPRAIERDAVLLSHSAHRYGERISDQCVRLLIDRLRPALDPPWRERVHPHMLRHSFAHELQRLVGPRRRLDLPARHRAPERRTPGEGRAR